MAAFRIWNFPSPVSPKRAGASRDPTISIRVERCRWRFSPSNIEQKAEKPDIAFHCLCMVNSLGIDYEIRFVENLILLSHTFQSTADCYSGFISFVHYLVTKRSNLTIESLLMKILLSSLWMLNKNWTRIAWRSMSGIMQRRIDWTMVGWSILVKCNG